MTRPFSIVMTAVDVVAVTTLAIFVGLHVEAAICTWAALAYALSSLGRRISGWRHG